MSYVKEAQVVYRSKHGEEEKILDAMGWLAAMCSHVPDKGEQMVRYYGHYSTVSRGKRKKAELDELIPSMLEPEGSSKAHRKNWARLIQKIYGLDPLTCPKCQGRMRCSANPFRMAPVSPDWWTGEWGLSILHIDSKQYLVPV